MGVRKWNSAKSAELDQDFEFASKRVSLAKHLFGREKELTQIVGSLGFANADLYPQLQAADVLAWLTRRELILRSENAQSSINPTFD
jgi:hypothetical protein